MSEAIPYDKIQNEINSLRKDVEYIKNHMVDADTIMTEEDYEDLLEYREQKRSGKLVKEADVLRELDV
ncbi:hypothetical protein JW930_05140 [Candidatus Woesearchaeota archaeon]|nr:hypothetical protein [Candidatus Woesearchaeota archaeon]